MERIAPNGTAGIRRRGRHWPRIYRRRYPSGLTAYVVDLGKPSGAGRARRTFPPRGEAETFAEQKRVERANEGTRTFAVTWEIRREAATCVAKLAPYQAKLTEAVDYYVQHVLHYRTSPKASDVIERMLEGLADGGRRETAIRTLRCFLGGIRTHGQQLPHVSLPDRNPRFAVVLAKTATCTTRQQRALGCI
jgi:hypothetical protein